MWGVDRQQATSRALQVKIANIVDEYAHGLSASVLRGHGLDFLGVRPFETGDSPRRIDWRASSRSDDETELVVRVFTPERKAAVLIVADLDIAMEYPKAKSVHALAVVELYARAAIAIGGTSRIVGLSKDGIIASPDLKSGDDLLLFLMQSEQPRMLKQLRQPWSSLKALFAEWKPTNTLVVFISDLRSASAFPLEAASVIDRVRQNVHFTYVVLDEWSGFVPSSHIVALRDPGSGKVVHHDLREGGEFHLEALRFQERVTSLRAHGRRFGMNVHLVPLAEERPLASFMRSWHKFQASRA